MEADPADRNDQNELSTTAISEPARIHHRQPTSRGGTNENYNLLGFPDETIHIKYHVLAGNSLATELKVRVLRGEFDFHRLTPEKAAARRIVFGNLCNAHIGVELDRIWESPGIYDRWCDAWSLFEGMSLEEVKQRVQDSEFFNFGLAARGARWTQCRRFIHITDEAERLACARKWNLLFWGRKLSEVLAALDKNFHRIPNRQPERTHIILSPMQTQKSCFA